METKNEAASQEKGESLEQGERGAHANEFIELYAGEKENELLKKELAPAIQIAMTTLRELLAAKSRGEEGKAEVGKKQTELMLLVIAISKGAIGKGEGEIFDSYSWALSEVDISKRAQKFTELLNARADLFKKLVEAQKAYVAAKDDSEKLEARNAALRAWLVNEAGMLLMSCTPAQLSEMGIALPKQEAKKPESQPAPAPEEIKEKARLLPEWINRALKALLKSIDNIRPGLKKDARLAFVVAMLSNIPQKPDEIGGEKEEKPWKAKFVDALKSEIKKGFANPEDVEKKVESVLIENGLLKSESEASAEPVAEAETPSAVPEEAPAENHEPALAQENEAPSAETSASISVVKKGEKAESKKRPRKRKK